MMIHPPDESAEVPEHSLDLGGVCKLKFGMQISGVFDRPPAIDTLVYRRTIGPELRARADFAVQKICRVMALRSNSLYEIERYLPRPDLLSHDEHLVFEECLVELYNMLQNVRFLR